MPSYFSIPLRSAPQIFLCKLAGRAVRLSFLYRPAAEAGWTMDIDQPDGTNLVDGIPLVLGADLLAPYREMFGSDTALVLQSNGPSDGAPAFGNLVAGFTLFFITNVGFPSPYARAPLSAAVKALLNPKPAA